jgi:hypothetical protein
VTSASLTREYHGRPGGSPSWRREGVGDDVSLQIADRFEDRFARDSSGAGHDATLVTEPLGQPLYQVVTRDKGTGDVVVKVVNARPHSLRTKVDLGPRRLSGRGTVTTLSVALTDQNSFAQPTKVAPTTTRVSGLDSRFVYDFAANSVTFIRLTRR